MVKSILEEIIKNKDINITEALGRIKGSELDESMREIVQDFFNSKRQSYKKDQPLTYGELFTHNLNAANLKESEYLIPLFGEKSTGFILDENGKLTHDNIYEAIINLDTPLNDKRIWGNKNQAFKLIKQNLLKACWSAVGLNSKTDKKQINRVKERVEKFMISAIEKIKIDRNLEISMENEDNKENISVSNDDNNDDLDSVASYDTDISYPEDEVEDYMLFNAEVNGMVKSFIEFYELLDKNASEENENAPEENVFKFSSPAIASKAGPSEILTEYLDVLDQDSIMDPFIKAELLNIASQNVPAHEQQYVDKVRDDFLKGIAEGFTAEAPELKREPAKMKYNTVKAIYLRSGKPLKRNSHEYSDMNKAMGKLEPRQKLTRYVLGSEAKVHKSKEIPPTLFSDNITANLSSVNQKGPPTEKNSGPKRGPRGP